MPRNRIVNLANLQQFTAINLLSDPGVVGGPVVIPNCTQVVLNWTLEDGKTAHNVLYGRSAGIPNPTPAQATALHTALSTGAAWTAFASALAPNTIFSGVSLRQVHTPGGALVQSTSAAVPGTGTGVSLPNEVAVCVTLRTANAGVSNRGRMYLPGLRVGEVSAGNVLAAATVSNITTWAAGFISIFSGQGLTLVIGQPARNAYVGSTGTAHPARVAGSIPVTQLLCRNNTFDSQRRRGLK